MFFVVVLMGILSGRAPTPARRSPLTGFATAGVGTSRSVHPDLTLRRTLPAFPPNLRRIIYTTNSIEALYRHVRKTIKTRGHFPTEDAARKLIYLSIINAQRSWRKAYNWSAALVAFKIPFGDRLI